MNSRQIINLVLLHFLAIHHLPGQQLPTFTQYRAYHSYLNPASIGHDYLLYEYNLSIGGSFRTQWSNVPGSPSVQFAKADYLQRTGGAFSLLLGSHLIKYETGPIDMSGVYGKFGALFSSDPYYGAFGVAFSVGTQQYRVHVDELEPYHLEDFILTDGNPTQRIPDLGWGLFFYKQFRDGPLAGDNFYAGLSMPQILGRDLYFKDEGGAFRIDRVYHVFLYAGYARFFSDHSFLEPSMWLKYAPHAPMQIDMNARYNHRQWGWIGAGYGFSSQFDRFEKLHFEVGYRFTNFVEERQRLSIGYGFDYTLGRINTHFGSAHELNLTLMLDTRKTE